MALWRERIRLRAAWAWGVMAALALVGLPDCRASDGGCESGQACSCSGGDECDLGCDGDGCQEDCYGVGERCGNVCGNNCGQVCHDVTTCTSYCGDNCAIDCHSVSTCAVICGAGCNYQCTNASTCGVEAGPGSTITCTSIAACDVQCTGTC